MKKHTITTILLCLFALFFMGCASSPPPEEEPVSRDYSPYDQEEIEDSINTADSENDIIMPDELSEESPDEIDEPLYGKELVMLQGTLIYDEIPPGKNLRAWTGDEFYLQLDSGESEVVLQPSDMVSREDLMEYHDFHVMVYGDYVDPEYVDPEDLGPMASYPTDMDGNPLPRGGGFQVMFIDFLDEY